MYDDVFFGMWCFGNSFNGKEIELIKSVLDSHLVGTGNVVSEFEEKFSQKIGFKFGVATNSCTNTFWLLFRALKLSENDEVILPNIHFFAIQNVLKLLNIKHSVVDVELGITNILLDDLKKKLTSNTKAIIFLEYSRYPLDIKSIKTYLLEIGRDDIYLILDAANSPFTQINGQYTATNYDFALYSFDMNKMLVTGDGGLLLSNNEEMVNKVRNLAYYGILDIEKSGYKKSKTSNQWWDVETTVPSLKMTMNNIAAAIGLAQLSKIDAILEKRHQIKDHYYQQLPNEILPPATKSQGNVYLLWIFVENRNQLAVHLLKKGIYTTVKYPPLDKNANTPNAFAFYEKCLCLPINQNLTNNNIKAITKNIDAFVRQWVK